MASSPVARLVHHSSGSVASRLRDWFNDLPAEDRSTVGRLLRHLLSFLSFRVLEGFIEAMIDHWILACQVFKFGSLKLSLTLEEYAQITGLPLAGPCARVQVGHMRHQFMTATSLHRPVVMSKITVGHVISLGFLIDRFDSSRSFAAFREDFAISEDRWRAVRADALMMCIISYLYMPIYGDHMDVGVGTVVRALHEDQTILPLILTETYISATYCRTFSDGEFHGSPVLLYVWFMTHLRPIGTFRKHGYCFGHCIAMGHSFRPSFCIDRASFLESIEDPFSVLMYSGYCSSFNVITHTTDLNFLPLAGLRGVTTYHPLALMGQFNQMQDLYSFDGAEEYRFPIMSSIERDLARVYGFWAHYVMAKF